MRYTGIGWGRNGFEVRTVEDGGRPDRPAAVFDANRIGDLVAHLRGLGPGAVVVESTNGVLDGRLMAEGIEVHRVDPEVLPERPVFGSAPASEVARAARRTWPAPTKLVRDRGTQTGLEDYLAAGYASTEQLLAEYTADGRWVSNGGRERQLVALTFDDGPQPRYTNQVLDVLADYGIPGTFFCVGMYARAHPAEMIRMREQGHAIGNHTYSHPFLPQLTRPQLAEQLTRTREAIAEACGADAALFRPPYGSRSPQVMRWLDELGTTSVLWDVAPDDWAMPGADTIARLTLEQTRPGSVVLLHDSGGDRSQTVAALPEIIEGLLARGYEFALVDDLVAAGSAAAETSVA